MLDTTTPENTELRTLLQNLCREHGIGAVTEVMMDVLLKHFRMQELMAAAERVGFTLLPFPRQTQTKGRRN